MSSWTCERCGVTARWMEGHEARAQPAGWVTTDGVAHCLTCRRDIAGEEACARAEAEGSNRADLAKLRMRGRVEFEIRRDPDRPNGQIAKAMRCSVPAVVKARRELDRTAADPAVL